MAVGSRTDCCGLRRHALIAGGAGHEQFEAFIRTPPPPRCTLARAPYLTPILAMNRASTLFKILINLDECTHYSNSSLVEPYRPFCHSPVFLQASHFYLGAPPTLHLPPSLEASAAISPASAAQACRWEAGAEGRLGLSGELFQLSKIWETSDQLHNSLLWYCQFGEAEWKYAEYLGHSEKGHDQLASLLIIR